MTAPDVPLTRPADALPAQIYRLIADTIPHMVWTAQPDGALDYFNQRVFEYTGMRSDELQGWGWRQVIHDDDWPNCLAHWTGAIESGEPYEIEYRLRRADGEYRWYLGAARPLRDASGRITKWFGTCTDIQDQRRAAAGIERANEKLEAMVAGRTLALRESEARFRSLTELSSDWYWEQDENFRFVDFSAEVEAAAGSSVKSDLGKTRWRLPVVGVSNEQWAEHRAALEAHRPFRDFEYQSVTERGDVIWISASGDPIFDAQGRFCGYRGIGRNITERKRAEIALRESEERFRSMIHLSTDFYWETDTEHRFTVLEVGGRSMPDFFPATRLGRTRWEVPSVAPDAEGWRAHRDMLEARLPFRDFETARPTADGRVRHYSISGEPMFDGQGAFKGYRGVGGEITDRKRAEQALRASEQRFQLFMDIAPVVAWIKDSRLRYTWANLQRQRSGGTSLQEMAGHDDFELRPTDWARQIRTQDEEVLRLRRPVQYVNRAPNPDGTDSDYLVVRFPLPDADGEAGVGGIAIDVTERYRLAQTVRELLKRLVDTQEAERRKVAADLHDLIGQKLTALGINLDIVRQGLPEAVSEALAPRLRQMSLLLEETIGSIREVMAELRPPALDDHGLVAALFQYASVFEGRTGLRVQVTGPERRVPLPRDIAIALFRIAQEALTNAAKHSGASRVQVRIDKNPQRVELCVEDDGRGFVVLDVARPDADSGWGVPAMRERAEAIGGQLSVESTGKGTRITVKVSLGNADQRHPG